MNTPLGCSACAQPQDADAKFCRKCGRSLKDGAADVRHAGAPPLLSSPPSLVRSVHADSRLLRELAWLCALPVLVSVAYAIAVRMDGTSVVKDVSATAAMTLIASSGALLNLSLVCSALHLPTAREFGKTALIALILAPTLAATFWFLHEVLGFALLDAYLEPYLEEGWPVALGYLEVAVVTPIAEELLFRGLIQPKLGQILSLDEAWIVQAALFAALHLRPVILLTHFLMGLALGYVRRSSGSLYPGIVLHGAWNAWVLASSQG